MEKFNMNKKLICPECNNTLTAESSYRYGKYIMRIGLCENCEVNWEFKCSQNNVCETTEKI